MLEVEEGGRGPRKRGPTRDFEDVVDEMDWDLRLVPFDPVKRLDDE